MDPVTPKPIETEEAIKIDKGDYFLQEETFGGEKTGFKFFIIQFKTVAAVLAKYSEDVVLKLINSRIASAMRVDAGNKLPKYPGDESKEKVEWAKLKLTQPVLTSESEAEGYIPGERELSYEGYINAAKRAMRDGDKAEARRLLQKAQEILDAEG